MSTLKMTFSLASLILILGLVFGTTAVMAHDNATDAVDTPRQHSHPLIEGLDAQTDVDGTTPGTAVTAHYGHPTVTSVALKADSPGAVRDNMVVIVADDTTTTDVNEHGLVLVVTFSEPVNINDGSSLTVTATELLAASALTIQVRNADGAIVTSPATVAGAAGDVTRVGDDGMAFEVPVTFADTSIPNGTEDDPLEYLTFYVQVNAGVAFGLAKPGGIGADIPGGANYEQASASEFMLMSALPDIPDDPDTTAPTVTITAADDLDAMGKVVFTLTFSEALGEGLSALALGDITITGGTAMDEDLTGPADGNVYTLTVTPTSTMNPSVTISLNADAVADAANNVLMTGDSTMATYDKTPPTVMITAPEMPDADGNLTFTFDFSEDVTFESDDIDRAGSDNVRLGADSDPVMDEMDSTIYTVIVEPKNPAVATTVLLLKGSVMDGAGNGLAADADATYTPPGAESTDPTITITAVGYMDSMDNVVGLNCEMGNYLTITAMDNEALAADAAVVMSEVSASAGWKVTAGATEGSMKLVPNADGTEIGVTSVTVTVAANAVMDTAGNGNAETMMTFTVGPVLTIPANGYITVIRPEHHQSNGGMTHLGDPLIVGSLGVRGGVVSIQTWECMPDLHIFFRRSAPGIGGGALVVKESAENDSTNNPVAKGTVGISEIMWGIDLGLTFGGIPPSGLSNLDHTREQWIELHNLNNHAVMVTLFARPTNAALMSETDEIDRVSNFNVRNAWDVKGQNGDSARGVDFIAMQRGTPTEITGKNYAHGDFNGSNSGKWSPSGFTYLRRQSTLALTGQLAAENLTYDFIGTPGRSNKVAPTGAPTATSIPRSPFVINEVANRDNRLYEWIEIRNTTDATQNIRNYLISIVTAVDTETAIYTFPNADINIPANGLLLIVASDPEDDAEHPIMVGYDVRGGNDQALGVNDNSARYIIAGSGDKLNTEGLPDDGKFVMFLRKPEAHDKANAKDKIGTHERVVDIAGYHDNLAKSGTYTDLWPLKAFPAPNLSHNSIAVNTVHFRRHDDIDGTKTKDGNKADKTALGDAGYTGIGYRRHATNSAAHGGTPGYHDVRKAKVADLTTGTVTISEIMFDRGDRDNYPQWIELYNSSATESVNLHADDGWRLEIQNYDDGEVPIDMLSGTLNFKSSEVQTILPQQTVLIASTRARNAGSSSINAGIVFIPTRVFSVWADARGALGMKRSTDPILSKDAFYLRLIDGKGNLSDQAGNLTRRRVRGAEAYWEWSEVQGEAMDARSSVIRRYRAPEAGVRSAAWERFDDDEIMDMGIEADGWVNAAATDFRRIERTWYGHDTDYGTPGATTGRALPVSLSKFRPERLDDGSIVIRWITESELNNAGFNILRSETRNGEYTQINTSLIAGKGTTTEQSLYEWKDTSAKPNVVYYYQIQDVSLDGKVTTLRQSRLKGNVSAAGKLTTIWGEIKALQ